MFKQWSYLLAKESKNLHSEFSLHEINEFILDVQHKNIFFAAH